MASVGIDLGTTNSCTGVEKNGRIEIIPYSSDSHTLPSRICFYKNEVLFGATAKNRSVRHAENTVYDVKRMIGRDFNDSAVQAYLSKWDFKVQEQEGKLVICVKPEKSELFYTPEELSGLLLKELKKKAEAFLDKNVECAVVTVPTYFDNIQRQATINAGKQAGFKEVILLNEPTAAAYAYIVENNIDTDRTIFVFDFGGGTLDVSLIKAEKKSTILDVKVITTDGDLELGGNDFDSTLLNYISKDKSLDNNKFKLIRLKQICEEAKKELSHSEEAYLEIDELFDEDTDATITRDLFNSLNENIFSKTKTVIENCLRKAQINFGDIDDIVMVGGSTKVPKICDMLTQHFQTRLRFNINPDEAVARGAAIYASKKWDVNSPFRNIKVTDICPYSLGVEVDGGIMKVLIPKDTELPATKTKTFGNSEANQEVILVNIYSGESEYVKDNHFLGTLSVSGFKPGPPKSVRLDETFEIDESGVLKVSVLDRTTGNKKHLKILLDKGKEVDVAKKTLCRTKSFSLFQREKNKLTDLCHDPRLRNSMARECDDVLRWLNGLQFSIENQAKVLAKIRSFEKHLK